MLPKMKYKLPVINLHEKDDDCILKPKKERQIFLVALAKAVAIFEFVSGVAIKFNTHITIFPLQGQDHINLCRRDFGLNQLPDGCGSPGNKQQLG